MNLVKGSGGEYDFWTFDTLQNKLVRPTKERVHHQKLTQDHVILRYTMSTVHSVLGNLFSTFLDHGAYPDAQVCGHNVC